MLVFCGSLFYLVHTAESLFQELKVLKEDLEPPTEDLRKLVSELKTWEDFLVSGQGPDLERARLLMSRARLFPRLAGDAASFRKVASGRNAGNGRTENLESAAGILEEMISGDKLLTGSGAARLPDDERMGSHQELFDRLVARLDSALTRGAEHETAIISRELLRTVRFLRSGVLRAHHRAAAGRREADQELFRRRADSTIALIALFAGALVVGLVLLLFSVRALRPMGELVLAVQRLARGDHSEVNLRSSRELAELSEALNSLAATLRLRESEQERRSEEMMRTERLAVVGRMASVVAHEVRNPLNSIALNVDLLREMLESSPDQEGRAVDVLRSVQREVDRLAEITEEYLRFGRMPKGVMTPCDVSGIVRDTRDFMEGEFAAASVEVRLDLPRSPSRIWSDGGQMRQALVNILRNAVEAMPGGGQIRVSVRPVGDNVILEVTDTGSGIPESFRERLFEPFATTKARGTGLGLAFVQQVAQESGGEASIESQPGRGTTVRLTLRRIPDQEA